MEILESNTREGDPTGEKNGGSSLTDCCPKSLCVSVQRIGSGDVALLERGRPPGQGYGNFDNAACNIHGRRSRERELRRARSK